MNLTEEQFKRLLDRYLAGQATAPERKLLDQFFDSYRSHGQSPELVEEAKLKLLEQFEARHTAPQPARLTIWKIAAAFAFLVLSSFLFFKFLTNPSQQPVTQVVNNTERGQRLELELPDGTRVMLNAMSRLTYSSNFRDQRDVHLEGEAYFDVAHDQSKPFIVHTRNAATKVLGTEFNVRVYGDGLTEVTLVKGSVNVSNSNGNTLLSPNEQATVSRSTIKKETVDADQLTAWTRNILLFEQTPLQDVAERLEQWYDVSIEIRNEKLKACRITAQYKGESLENVLRSLEFLLNVSATKDASGRLITINGKECK